MVSCYWLIGDWYFLVLQQLLLEVSCCKQHLSILVLIRKSKPPHTRWSPDVSILILLKHFAWLL